MTGRLWTARTRHIGTGAAAIAVDDHGRVQTTAEFADYLGGAALPVAVEPPS